MPISIAIYQADGSRSPRHQFPEEETDKEKARRKMRSDCGNNVAKSCANSTDARLAIRRRYFIEEISPPSVLPSARGAFRC
ncbi:unnamed protein product [Lasius platythorax]|uniref:Uncharacterized protein n=1 Tax=Lasius platythorax TaxID=488582 RepID=A0AAV2P0H8_9HYME